MNGNKILQLTPKPVFENTSKQVLEEAIQMNPDTVICFCFDGDRIHIKTSGLRSTLELIGALEAAKQQLWSNA